MEYLQDCLGDFNVGTKTRLLFSLSCESLHIIPKCALPDSVYFLGTGIAAQASKDFFEIQDYGFSRVGVPLADAP